MKIYLIRHGRQCSRLCNVNVDLAKEGYLQARLLGSRLEKAGIEAVYSSHLLRAVETADTANEIWQAPRIIRQEIREISFGHMEGMTDKEICEKYKDFKIAQAKMEEDLPYPGGECGQDVVNRAFPLLKEIGETEFQTVAVVTHGGVIRALTAWILGMDMARWRQLGKDLENCSITELRYDRERKVFTLERFNDYAHLEAHPHLLRKGWICREN